MDAHLARLSVCGGGPPLFAALLRIAPGVKKHPSKEHDVSRLFLRGSKIRRASWPGAESARAHPFIHPYEIRKYVRALRVHHCHGPPLQLYYAPENTAALLLNT